MNNALKGITLIELLIAIAIAAVITSSVYFSLNTALESWGQARNQLGLQKVLSELIDEIGGSAVSYGIRDSLEVIEAGAGRIKFVPPWTDDAHSSSSRDFIYTLNRRIKPDTALPIGEMRFPESNKFQLVPVRLIELEDTSLSLLTRHPDAPSHQVDQLRTDCQSQARATESPVGRGICLIERLEDVFLLVFWDADSGIFNGTMQPYCIVARFFER